MLGVKRLFSAFLKSKPQRPIELRDLRMAGGSRFFASIDRTPLSVKSRLQKCREVSITDCIGTIVEMWIDFEYRGYAFSVHNPVNECEVDLFVGDPSCPDDVLREVVEMLR